jgi:hypothetical protein
VEQASACLVLNVANAAKFKCKHAEQAAEKWHLRASGVKTPDESNALTSWLKPRPTNPPTFSAACSACLVLNIANAAKFKCKQAEACSTGGSLPTSRLHGN